MSSSRNSGAFAHNSHSIYRVLLVSLIFAAVIMAAAFNRQAFSASPSSARVEPSFSRPAARDQLAYAQASEKYGKLPLQFEVNRGQTDGRVKFISHGRGYSLFLTPSETVLALSKSSACAEGREAVAAPGKNLVRQAARAQTAVLRMRLIGANRRATMTGEDELPGNLNYFRGNDPRNWQTDISTYGKVRYKNVYRGVDLIYYGDQRQLEYDLVIAPGQDPSVIRLGFTGTERVRVSEEGELVLETAGGEVRQRKPFIYQEIAGKRKEIDGSCALTARGEVRFNVGAYDPRQPLVIDPVLSYSTYLGGNDNDRGNGIAVDSAGNVYITGQTNSTNFPTTNALQAKPGANSDAFVAKLNATGSALVYSTYLGGSGSDVGNAIAVDAAGNVYVTGMTDSSDFPTASPLQATYGGYGDAFITKLNAAGNALVFSTCLGGNSTDVANGIALDPAGNVYVAGQTNSSNFPTANAMQSAYGGGTPGYYGEGGGDAFVAKLNTTGTQLVYSTYLGGSNDDGANGIAVDSAGNAYLTGQTNSNNFPTVNPLQLYSGGSGPFDAFVAKLNAAGSALVYSTYLSGSSGFDGGSAIAVDSAGSAYITGSTGSADFPTTAHAVQPVVGGVWINSYDAFVTKFNPDGSALVYSTFLGGKGNDQGRAIAVDSAGNAYVTGLTNSDYFPGTNFFTDKINGSNDAFVSKLNADGSALVYSAYLGGVEDDYGYGIAVDSAGNAYVTGSTTSPNYPTVNPLQASLSGMTAGSATDAFVTKVSYLTGVPTPTPTPLPTPVPGTDGKIAFARDGNIYLMNSDGGNQVSLTHNDGTYWSDTDSEPAWSPDGTKIAFTSTSNFDRQKFEIDVISADGTNRIRLPDVNNPMNSSSPSWSPDGTKIAYTGCGGVGVCGIYVMNADGSNRTALTGMPSSGTGNFKPRWSPDGTRILFESQRDSNNGANQIYVMNADGSNQTRLTTNAGANTDPIWSPDGKIIAYVNALGGDSEIYVMNADGSNPQRITNNKSYNFSPAFSPDGTRIAFGSDGNVNVMNLDGSGITTLAQGGSPAWQPVAGQPVIPRSMFQFGAANYSVTRFNGSVTITVTRLGQHSEAATVDYATSNGTASDRSDYTTAIGTLSFAPGEASHSFPVLITQNGYAEGDVTVNLTLSNPTGGPTLDSLSASTLTISSTNYVPPSPNPIDDAQTFVIQHYHDFLNREPDPAGLQFWTHNITSCGKDQACIDTQRVNTSAAYFLSIEFQQTGYLIDRIYKAGLGRRPLYLEFLPDTQAIGRGVVVGASGWEQTLENNKQAFVNAFVQRASFKSLYDNKSNAQYVDSLITNTGVVFSQTDHDALVNGLDSGTETRATVLRKVAEGGAFTQSEFNPAFVLMQYFGYLRRNPSDAPDHDLSGFNFWLAKLNQFGGDYNAAQMVQAFIASSEYRKRFGQP